MTLSYALKTSLSSKMFTEVDSGWYNYASIAPNFKNNTVFSKFFEVILPYEGECFLPVLGLSGTMRYIQQWFDKAQPTQSVKLSLPLYVGGSDTKKTADAIIQSINRCPVYRRLSKITTSKGLDYYGGQGLIFDEHWTPLMLCGFVIDINRTNRHITVVKPVCYISPIVFENSDILSRAIVKKIIPYIGTQGIEVPDIFRNSSCVSYNYSKFRNIPVTIKFFDDYFTSPASPTIIEGLNDSIWDFLAENVGDLR